METKPDILLSASTLLKNYFSVDCNIKSTELLSEPTRRYVILRLYLQSAPNAVPSTVILKQSLSEKGDADDKDAYARFARDWAGLQFLSNLKTMDTFFPGGASGSGKTAVIPYLKQN